MKDLKQLISKYKTATAKEARKSKIIAKSKIFDDKQKAEKERIKKVKKAAETLTKSLPDKSNLNPNWRAAQLRSELIDWAFCSALENGIQFKRTKSDGLEVEGLKVIQPDLKEQAEKLYKWSDLGRNLLDDKGKMPNEGNLWGGLVLRAANYQTELLKGKTSEQHLNAMVKAVASANIDGGAVRNRQAAKDVLAKAIVGVTKNLELNFTRDMSGNVHLNCANQTFGAKKMAAKELEPYFKTMIENSPVAGKLKASFDARDLAALFISKMPR